MVMSSRKDLEYVNFKDAVFDLNRESKTHGAWLWWFWLFFFDNPKDPARPRQLMILWSTKNVKKITCNDCEFTFNHTTCGDLMDGVVAAWYFDGELMHHNLILEQCNLRMSGDSLSSESSTPTSFTVDSSKSRVKIGDRFDFTVEGSSKHKFNQPTYFKDKVILDYSYSLLRHNILKLKGVVDGQTVSGTGYFQRVSVNAPIPPWYWGVFHFEKGGVLTYFKPHIMDFELRGDIHFFDGVKMHVFYDMEVKCDKSDTPTFTVSGKNDSERISFNVASYSHSSWTFKSKPLNLLKTKLVYNEYPSKITDLELTSPDGKTILSFKDLGESIGNSELSEGVLL